MRYWAQARNALRPLLIAAGLMAAMAGSAAWGRTEEVNTHVAAAQALLQKGDLRGAEIELRNAIQKAPEDGELRLELGKIYLREGNGAAAEAAAIAARQRGVAEPLLAPVLAEAYFREGQFGKILQVVLLDDREPTSESAVRLWRGFAHQALGETDQAGKMFRDAERLDPQAVGPKVALSRWLLGKGEVDGAEKEARAALAVAPNDSRALDALGAVLATKGEVAASIAQFDKAIEQNQYDLQARLDRANAKIVLNDLDGAQTDLTVILGRSPGSPMANYLQALIFTRGNNAGKADAALAKMGDALNQYPNAVYLAGIVKYSLGQFEQAEQYLSKYVAVRPNQPLPYVVLAAIALRKRDPDTAIEMLQRALAIAPNDTRALGLLGQAYMAKGDATKAAEALEQALKQSPDNVTLQTEVAVSRIDNGQAAVGLAELEQAFASDRTGMVAGPVLVLSALKTGQIDKASETAEEMVRRQPTNTLARELLGIVRYAQGNYSEAETIFRTLLKENSDLAPARRNLAQVLVAMNRAEDAKKLYQEAIDKDPKDVLDMTLLAGLYAREQNMPEAIKLLIRARDASTTDPGPGLRLVSVYASLSDWKSALTAARELDTRFPKNITVLDALARVQLGSGDAAQAAATYQRAVELDPKYVPLLLRYAGSLMAAGDFAQARVALKQALAVEPDNQQVRLGLVTVDYRAGGTEAALATARSIYGDNPDRPVAELEVAQILALAGKPKEAMTLLEQKQASHPTSSVAAAIAALYAKAGDRDRAIDLLKTWLAAHQDDTSLRAALGQLYLANRNYDSATAELERAATERNNDPVVLNNLAWLYQRKSDPRALKTAERAFSLAPNSAAVEDTLGWILTSGDKADLGLRYLRAAGAALPQDLDIQYHLAVALQKTGSIADARAVLQRIANSPVEFDSKADAKALLAQIGNG